jgi:hypothetical protein
MITFNISTSKGFFNIACDDNAANHIGSILDSSPKVRAFNRSDNKSHEAWFKYSKALSKETYDAMTDNEVSASIIDAIVRINDRREKEYGGCHYESFVGGPGDYSPPDCNCERCIAAGRAFRFNSRLESVDSSSFHKLYEILKPLSKLRKWGLEYDQPSKCRITMQDHSQDIYIRTNKEDIKIGPYAFSHKTKKFKLIN